MRRRRFAGTACIIERPEVSIGSKLPAPARVGKDIAPLPRAPRFSIGRAKGRKSVQPLRA